MNVPAPLILTGTTPRASGGGRIIYDHPTRADVIIKIHKPGRAKRFAALRRRLRPAAQRFGLIRNSFIEVEEFAASVGTTGVVPDFFAQFRGFVQTDIGPGVLFDAVRGDDGALAPTLKSWIIAHGFCDEMHAAIVDLWSKIERSGMIVADTHLSNMLVTGSRAAGFALTVVDGIGDKALIPLRRYSRRLFIHHCTTRRDRMIERSRALDAAPPDKKAAMNTS